METELQKSLKNNSGLKRDTPIYCWDGSWTTIGKIMSGKVKPTIIGMDIDGNLVPSTIINCISVGKQDNWLEITTSLFTKSTPRKFLITPDHPIFINNEFKKISDAKINDEIYSFDYFFSEEIVHFIESSLLGDGSLSKSVKNHKYEERHKKSHKSLCDYVQKCLGESYGGNYHAISGYGSDMIAIYSKTLKGFSVLRDKWYPNDKKEVPSNLDWMDNFTIAKWYMDDGSLIHLKGQKDRALFATNGFTKNDTIRLADKLHEMYGVDAKVYDNKGWTLRINAGKNNEIDKFWIAIAPHIIDCMRYKLPDLYKNIDFTPYSFDGKIVKKIVNEKIINIRKITEIELKDKEIFPSGRRGFHLETTTGNYIANKIIL